MKALTVRQPWASLIVAGIKDVENRTWPIPSTAPAVPFRLAIHSAKRMTDDDYKRARWQALVEGHLALVINYANPGLRGVVLGLVTVTGCHRADGWPKPASIACCASPWAEHDDGVWHWTLADATPLPMPFHAKGRLGLWEVAA